MARGIGACDVVIRIRAANETPMKLPRTVGLAVAVSLVAATVAALAKISGGPQPARPRTWWTLICHWSSPLPRTEQFEKRGHAVPPSLSETTHGRWHRCRMGFPLPAPFPTQRTEETIHMKAIVVTDQAAGTAGMALVERPEPHAAINDVVVQIHASGFVPTELAWPSTWTDRLDRDRTPSVPGHELAGVVTALGYGTRGLSVGQRVFGLTDWY